MGIHSWLGRSRPSQEKATTAPKFSGPRLLELCIIEIRQQYAKRTRVNGCLCDRDLAVYVLYLLSRAKLDVLVEPGMRIFGHIQARPVVCSCEETAKVLEEKLKLLAR